MTSNRPTYPRFLSAPAGPAGRRAQARQLASEVRQLWRQGQSVDLPTFLAKHPDLAADRSAVLDLAFEEYCLLREAGGSPDPDELCRRFPVVRSALRGLIRARLFLEHNPDLLAESQQVSWPEPGNSFLGFSLLRELGRGAFARVFLANEPALGGRRVAVKIAHRGAAEAEVLGRLSHPNIVPVFSVHTDPPSGLTLVCMPYLGSATLGDVLGHVFGRPGLPSSARVILEGITAAGEGDEPPVGPDPPSLLLRKGTYVEGVAHLAAQVADALAFIHSRDVCHHDLKPSNVLLSPQGRPMLLDFNLSADPQLADRRLGGTLPYMPPEQLRATGPEGGQCPAAVDARSDLFSFGVIVYELLTGQHPFGPIPAQLPAREVCAWLLERQRAGPRPAHKVNPRLDRSLAQLLQRCLAFEPERRPRSAAEVAGVLRNYLGRFRRLQRWAARHTVVLAAAALLLLAAGLGAAFFLPAPAPASPDWLERGWDCYRQGDYEQAVEHLNRGIDVEPGSAPAWFARGRAYQQLGELVVALESYRRADRLVPDGRSRACMGYCSSRLHQHNAAIRYYDQAIEAGFAPAEVFNDRGFSFLEAGEWSKARQSFDEAILRNPRLQAPHHNRAFLDFRKALKSPGYIPLSGIADVEEALKLGPATARLHYDAACLYAVAARQDHRQIGSALRHVQKAIELGQEPSALAGDRSLSALFAEPQFQTLVKQPWRPAPPQKSVLLLDPVPDSSL